MSDLDTRSKRASSVQLLQPSLNAPVFPDGTISQGDQQHIAHTYSGILAGGFVPPLVTSADDYIIRARRRGRR